MSRTTTGAIYTFGAAGTAECLLLWIKLRITLVLDLRPPNLPTREVPQFYALARGGERILLLDKKPDPRGTWRHQAVMLPLAQDQERYAASAMGSIIGRIDLAHVIGDLLVPPLEFQRATETKTAAIGKRWAR